LEKELEVALNFLKRTATSTTKPILQIIIISDSEEEVEIGPQSVVEEQVQSIFASTPVEEEEL
jgi:hypothetical protein